MSGWFQRGLVGLFVLSSLVGCSSGASNNVTVSPVTAGSSTSATPSPTPVATTVTGIVQSGGTNGATPMKSVAVTIYEATNGPVQFVGTAKTDASGAFAIRSARTTSSGIFYATADLGTGQQLTTIIGQTLRPSITINELTTVAAGFSMAQFTVNGNILGDVFGLRIAAGMNDNLVSASSGASSPVILSSPNGDESNTLRSTRALANLLAFYTQNQGAGLSTFYRLATPPGGTTPTTTLQALSNICRFPQQNVATIYSLTKNLEVYTPALAQMPDAWTLAVKVNNSGDDNYLPSGPGNLAFDANGFAWVTNNTFQNSTKSGNFAFVLQPNGQPANGANNTPKSPIFGGGILGGGYGVAIDASGNAWLGNFGWGGVNPGPTGSGSLSEVSPLGVPISLPNGYQGGTDRAQGFNFDRQGNLFIASFNNDRLVVFPNGNPNNAFWFQEATGAAPFDVQIAADGTVWLTNSGGLTPNGAGSVARYALVNGVLQQLFLLSIGHSNKGFSLDSQGNAWVASGGDNAVYLINPAGSVIGTFTGGGIVSPWGTTVDGDDNVWVANFGSMVPGSDYTNAGVTRLAGGNAATRPPGLNRGDPISPPSGYTLPSAGAQVLLHNGQPLYGPNGPPCFSPLQRMTAVQIDSAGNLWALNNWKPNFDIDVTRSPGGDGICIFVGLAKPPVRKR